METNHIKILSEAGYYGHVLSKKLPQGLDNRLYALISLIGGDIKTEDVILFGENATPQEIDYLYEKVRQFPSKINEILPYAGAYRMLADSPQYQEIIDLVKFKEELSMDIIEEQIESHEYAHTYDDRSGDMYFSRYMNPQYKEKLFKYWDKIGNPEYSSLKLFGVEEEIGVEGWSDFRNVGDIIYPVLVIEWLGGVENTDFAKAPWKETNEMGFAYLKFKVEPISFDYLYDDSSNFGENGYACWDIRVLIDKDSDLTLPVNKKFIDNDYLPYIQELFPESARNKLSSFRNYTEDQFELIEELWMQYEEYRSLSSQFCKVEIVLV